ncbi:MAG: HAD family hydrolase [Chlamydiota bacterium]|nr:HAD family hydrolase [Chlamydiota bacterium]
MKILATFDIDGTITDKHHELSAEVIDYFSSLYSRGITLAFITGRTFSWGYQVLRNLKIPYYFSVQNGAITLKMPERKIVSKKYIDASVFSMMNAICHQEMSDYVVYSGYEGDDTCYYRADKFDCTMLDYLKKRFVAIKEDWQEVASFDDLPIKEFASVKCFGDRISAERIAKNIEQQLKLYAPVIRDPFSADFFIVQATHPKVTKGEAVGELKKILKDCEKVISAGDDVNDIPMLKAADVKVVMETAPEHMHCLADVVAPSARDNGIISGMNQALEFLK